MLVLAQDGNTEFTPIKLTYDVLMLRSWTCKQTRARQLNSHSQPLQQSVQSGQHFADCQLPYFCPSFQPRTSQKKMKMLVNSIVQKLHFSPACLLFPTAIISSSSLLEATLHFTVRCCYSLADLWVQMSLRADSCYIKLWKNSRGLFSFGWPLFISIIQNEDCSHGRPYMFKETPQV